MNRQRRAAEAHRRKFEDSTVTSERDVESYFHCGRCIDEGLYPNIGVGVNSTGTHLEVWCENHDRRFGRFELKNSMRPMPCAMCAKGEPH
jgi:hypothetical protein